MLGLRLQNVILHVLNEVAKSNFFTCIVDVIVYLWTSAHPCETRKH